MNLNKHHCTVDYVLTHNAPNRVGLELLSQSDNNYKKDKIEDKHAFFFNRLIDKGLTFTQWHFGHWHKDIEINTNDGNFFCHYEKEPFQLD